MQRFLMDARGRATLVSLTAGTLVLAVLLSGDLAGMPSGDLPPVYAACGVNPNCGGDPGATSALDVSHANVAYTREVEPNTGETWAITATWSTNASPPDPCSCADGLEASVTASVTWADGTGWSVNCTGCDPVSGPVRAVTICNTGSCGGHSSLDNGFAYKLLVDVVHTRLWDCYGTPYWTYVSSVAYATTSVDDGNLVDTTPSPCTEGSAVSPTSQVWTATDTGGFECGISCNNTGAAVTILYQ